MNEDWSKTQHHYAIPYTDLMKRLGLQGSLTRIYLEPDGEYIHLHVQDDTGPANAHPGQYIEIEVMPSYQPPFVKKAP